MSHRSGPVIVCLLWSISVVGYAQSIVDSVSRSDRTEARIRETLDEDTRLEFIETPLEQICAFLSEIHAIPVQIDTRALKEAGLDSDVPVTRNLKGISLGSALDLLLEEHELSWVVRDEVLLITTAAAASAKATVRVHNVSDLLGFGETADRVASTLEAVLGDQPPVAGAPVIRIVPFQQIIIVRSTEPGHRDVTSLLAQIRASIHGPPAASRTVSSPPAALSKTQTRSSVKLEWGVGERVRYGLAGFMDFDGDDKSDRELLRALILSSKGILDAEAEDNGEVKGRMSIHTHYLVVGDPPDRSKEASVKAYNAMMAEGERFGIQKVSAEKVFRKLQEHAEETRKREQRATMERGAGKTRSQHPFGGGTIPFGGGGGANPFGGSVPPAKPKGAGADPLGAPAAPAKADPFGGGSGSQPKDVGADPFGAPAPPAKPKPSGIADPFGGPAPPATPTEPPAEPPAKTPEKDDSTDPDTAAAKVEPKLTEVAPLSDAELKKMFAEIEVISVDWKADRGTDRKKSPKSNPVLNQVGLIVQQKLEDAAEKLKWGTGTGARSVLTLTIAARTDRDMVALGLKGNLKVTDANSQSHSVWTHQAPIAQFSLRASTTTVYSMVRKEAGRFFDQLERDHRQAVEEAGGN